jgi:hypothetical protein
MAIKTEGTERNSAQSLAESRGSDRAAQFGYAISLLQGILKQEPQFLTGRQLLRRAEVTKSKSTKKVSSISRPRDRGDESQGKSRKIRSAVEMLEKFWKEHNRQANLVQSKRLAADWPEIGVFALRTLLEEDPRDVKVLSRAWPPAS